jgi:hypothetical protein
MTDIASRIARERGLVCPKGPIDPWEAKIWVVIREGYQEGHKDGAREMVNWFSDFLEQTDIPDLMKMRAVLRTIKEKLSED